MKLTYSQLEGVWIDAGGQKSLAPLMAAIALAESGGNPSSLNATDNGGTQSSFGLWQISTGTHTPPSPQWADPITNAKLAIGKLHSQGLSAWGTYTSKAYEPFLKNGVPPTSVTGTTMTPVDNAVGETGGAPVCAWNINLPVAGATCLLTKTQARALLGGLVIAAGVIVSIIGTVLLVGMGRKHVH